MRRALLITFGLLLTLFLAISAVKMVTNPDRSIRQRQGKSPVEKQKIQAFWQIYREATRLRLAGNSAQAVRAYERALQLNPTHEDALYYLGNLYAERARLEDAEKMWQKLAGVNPQSSRANQQLGALYLDPAAGGYFDPEKARLAFERAHAINREETGPILRLGEVALLQERWQDAGRYFDEVLGSNFRSREAYFYKAYLAWRSGDFERALAFFDRAQGQDVPVSQPPGVLGEGDTHAAGRSIEVQTSSPFLPILQQIDQAHSSSERRALLEAMDARLTSLRQRLHR